MSSCTMLDGVLFGWPVYDVVPLWSQNLFSNFDTLRGGGFIRWVLISNLHFYSG